MLPACQEMRKSINKRHISNGVCMIDPATTYIEDTVLIAPGVIIYPNVILEGCCEIDEGAIIGANSHLKNTVVGKGAHVSQSVAVDARIGANTVIGPFAYLRPNADIGEKCKVGSFVEVKNSKISDETSVAHLAYIGDADVGRKVNVGCGVITANYDGKNKHRTTIGDYVFVGSNSNLIAPVTVGDGAYIAAGSTITDDLQCNALGIARARQVQKLDWKKPEKI